MIVPIEIEEVLAEMPPIDSSYYRVILTDADRFPLSEDHLKNLNENNIELIGIPSGLSEEQLAEACMDADGVIVFGSKITHSVIERMGKCQILARCGIGFDNINVPAARAKGITVTYVPDYCIEEVSDHTVSLMLDCCRKLSSSRERVNQGFWDPYENLGTIRRIAGQTVGLLGFGRIAQMVARKLKGFNVNLIACDPYALPQSMIDLGVTSVSFGELIQTSDMLSILVPLTLDTKHILNRAVFDQMKPGIIIINTSRGELMDEGALVHALNERRIAAVGLDVLEQEPPDPTNPLLAMSNVIITPHSAAFSEEALHEVKARAIQEIIRKFQNLDPLMPVPIQSSYYMEE